MSKLDIKNIVNFIVEGRNLTNLSTEELNEIKNSLMREIPYLDDVKFYMGDKRGTIVAHLISLAVINTETGECE